MQVYRCVMFYTLHRTCTRMCVGVVIEARVATETVFFPSLLWAVFRRSSGSLLSCRMSPSAVISTMDSNSPFHPVKYHSRHPSQ